MRSARLATIVATLCLAAAASAQTPNFAGKWTMVPDPAATGGMGGGLGQEATITQDATSITIKRTTQMGEFTSTYKLDGSESKNTITIQGNSIDQLSTTKWDGGTLKVDTTMSFDGNPVQVSMKMSLDPSGTLLVESTRPDFQGGGAPITTKTTYKKG
jgi:polyisoprenoid-binding protein YceI